MGVLVKLALLGTSVRDQDDLERDIGRQADQILTEQADERDKKRLEKTQVQKLRLTGELNTLERRLLQPGSSAVKNKIRSDILQTQTRLDGINTELEQIQSRIDERHAHPRSENVETCKGRLPHESERDFLIRTGKITPFSKVRKPARLFSNLEEAMLDAEMGDDVSDIEEENPIVTSAEQPRSHRNLTKPGFEDVRATKSSAERPIKKQKRPDGTADTLNESIGDGSDDEFEPELNDRQLAALGESEDSEVDFEDMFPMDTIPASGKRKAAGKEKKKFHSDEVEDLTGIDDGNEKVFQIRVGSWIERRSVARRVARETGHSSTAEGVFEEALESGAEECYLPHPSIPDTTLDGGLRIPGDIYPSLFDYQKTGVKWLSELYSQQVGGIIGDEMGLGKTIQAISFIAGLHYSKMLTKPVLIVTPATVMKQWVNEFHRWWPPLRVSILHSSGSGMVSIRSETRREDELAGSSYEKVKRSSKFPNVAKDIVDKAIKEGHVLITTYTGLQSYAEYIIPTKWQYVVLDEGHKIRNPNAGITIYCKELKTPNRIILSGTPMQNNLTELWSLFDFVFPMRLGTLVSFRTQFGIPIQIGGYANASNLQVQTAIKCAETLKETISGYLLQRYKVDVATDLPQKRERVLFCKLTKIQRQSYEIFLNSEEMKSIMNGRRQPLYGVDILRKICNHPDLVDHKNLSKKSDYDYGRISKSGKMHVVKALLETWKKGGYKALLFAQHRITIDILEKLIRSMDGFNYCRMDGKTAIKDRQTMVDDFNNDSEMHVFLLTTKVGGLGVNLTGANRIIIYDPDWNPSTDVQARERAWRLGQKREVEVYRLMTAGTIEEKIYHRQIFKQFLSNKILRDPKQRQTFQLRDLHDLFALGSDDGETETSTIFKGTEVKFSNKDSKDQSEGIPTPPTDTEIADIHAVAREEEFRNNEDTKQENACSRNDRLLSAIFAGNGVQSALEHDAILASNSGDKRKIEADPEDIAREARRVAAEAAKELQRNAEIARTVPAGTPTWTGAFGVSGRPPSKQWVPPSPRDGGRGSRGGPSPSAVLSRPNPQATQRVPPAVRGGGRGGRGGPSSSAVLSRLSSGQRNVSNRPGSGPPGRPAIPLQGNRQPPTVVLAQLRDFILLHGGSVPSRMLTNHFQYQMNGDAARIEEFKALLRRIANLEPGLSSGRGRWVLKDEFRPSES
ncbi:hypothetical protein M501DRAFT_1005942 [Patellaria atrata CBS 101060]|uniref:DNA repair and recombination protein RAD26 n=1 Tax=Patellaria atrata CBS 101060 TaxID=1346257 RepID=A0A9P4SIL4_9PEZI|nr:hypothetical protein M501DRAFT_1005942 [Patellaria atrata CBS 101060]